MSLLAALLLTSGVAACGGAAPPPAAAPGTPSAPPDPDDDARAMLAARAALAQDHRFAALYHFDVPGAPQHNVVATVANDGSWRVDIAAGALGGTADVSIVSTADGVYQCSLPSVANPVGPNCVRVADPGKRVPEPYDPKVERLFRTWLSVFTDRQSALSVTAAGPLPGSQGSCFSIDSISASLNPPVDVGIYCFTADGLLTAARVGFGVLTIASTPVTPPAKVDLPGPVSSDPPMSMASPPPPPVVSVAPSA
jgi:hypothetical protein